MCKIYLILFFIFYVVFGCDRFFSLFFWLFCFLRLAYVITLLLYFIRFFLFGVLLLIRQTNNVLKYLL